ncbi:Impact family like protein [Aduncisulcus paluster]|uniref:Impact family like protein n=1 Tax=Aduncisulcus paluster TaxID=2918883 RepID=A0ABQ5KG57_9EUKA|nr:Impact family like protein [Aduncisulcus paluster]
MPFFGLELDHERFNSEVAVLRSIFLPGDVIESDDRTNLSISIRDDSSPDIIIGKLDFECIFDHPTVMVKPKRVDGVTRCINTEKCLLKAQESLEDGMYACCMAVKDVIMNDIQKDTIILSGRSHRLRTKRNGKTKSQKRSVQPIKPLVSGDEIDSEKISDLLPITSFPPVSLLPYIVSTPVHTEMKSSFRGFGCFLHHPTQAPAFVQYLKDLFKDVRTATHNVMAFRICHSCCHEMPPDPFQHFSCSCSGSGSVSLEDGFDEDGEAHAGPCLSFILQQKKVSCACVVVSRRWGGVMLGPLRFKIFKNVTAQVVDLLSEKWEAYRDSRIKK